VIEQRLEQAHYRTSGVRMIARPLDRAGVFSLCTQSELQRIHQRGETMAIESGVVIQPMMRLNWVYVVAEGTVAVDTGDHAFVFGSGTAVGARSALTGHVPLATVVALARVCIFVIDGRELVGAMRTTPSIAYGIARQLADDPGAP
jgi:hypothetical protein